MHGSTAIVNGNQRSCGQDALVNGAKALGIVITKAQVHDEILPLQGDTAMGVIVAYAQSIGIEMLNGRVHGTIGSSETLFRAKGGPEHALLQLTAGVFFVEVSGPLHIYLLARYFLLTQLRSTSFAYSPPIIGHCVTVPEK